MSSDEEKPEQMSLDDIIDSWLFEVGEPATTKGGIPYQRVELESYPDALNSLLQTILSQGYKRDDVDSRTLLKKVQEALTPEIYDTHKLEGWYAAIERVWKYWISKEYARPSIVKPPKVYPKAPPKLKIEREETNPDDVVNETYTPPKSKLDPEKFQGYGDAQWVEDEDFSKLFEGLKK